MCGLPRGRLAGKQSALRSRLAAAVPPAGHPPGRGIHPSPGHSAPHRVFSPPLAASRQGRAALRPASAAGCVHVPPLPPGTGHSVVLPLPPGGAHSGVAAASGRGAQSLYCCLRAGRTVVSPLPPGRGGPCSRCCPRSGHTCTAKSRHCLRAGAPSQRFRSRGSHAGLACLLACVCVCVGVCWCARVRPPFQVWTPLHIVCLRGDSLCCRASLPPLFPPSAGSLIVLEQQRCRPLALPLAACFCSAPALFEAAGTSSVPLALPQAACFCSAPALLEVAGTSSVPTRLADPLIHSRQWLRCRQLRPQQSLSPAFRVSSSVSPGLGCCSRAISRSFRDALLASRSTHVRTIMHGAFQCPGGVRRRQLATQLLPPALPPCAPLIVAAGVMVCHMPWPRWVGPAAPYQSLRAAPCWSSAALAVGGLQPAEQLRTGSLTHSPSTHRAPADRPTTPPHCCGNRPLALTALPLPPPLQNPPACSRRACSATKTRRVTGDWGALRPGASPGRGLSTRREVTHPEKGAQRALHRPASGPGEGGAAAGAGLLRLGWSALAAACWGVCGVLSLRGGAA